MCRSSGNRTSSDWYGDDINYLQKKKPLSPRRKSLLLIPLSIYVYNKGILRIGGLLNKANFSVDEINPVILPGKAHITRLLVTRLHLHEKMYHQGRMIKEGSVRSKGNLESRL